MELRLLTRGVRFQISVDGDTEDGREVYEAIFFDMHDLANESSVIVQCSKLNRAFNQLGRGTVLKVVFSVGSEVFTFKGIAASKMYSDMIIIEKTGAIEPVARRVYQRDEIRVDVKIYGLPEEMLGNHKFREPEGKPLLTERLFDISTGGICVITNIILKSEHDPFYLTSFSLTRNDLFILPAILVRRVNCARSSIGKYDYGFQFYFDGNPEEKSRLTKSILSRKISSYEN